MKLSNSLRNSMLTAALNLLYDGKREAILLELQPKVEEVLRSKPLDYLEKAATPPQYQPYINYSTQTYIYRQYKSNILLSIPTMWASKESYYGSIRMEEADFPEELKRLDQLDANMESDRNEIKSLLASVNTSKQLREICPNLTQFLPPEEQGILVPIQLIERVNKLFERKPE